MNKRMIVCFSIFLILCAPFAYGQTGITFTFDNAEITGSGPLFFEFDVMAQGSAAGTKFGDALVYINYSTTAFDVSIVANSKITVTKGTLIDGELQAGVALYDIVNTTDNSISRVAITTSYNFGSSIPNSANSLPSTPIQYLHIKIQIVNPVSADLSFQESLMQGQQFASDNTTTYSPVTATDVVDIVLPVELTSFSASAGNGRVILSWATESETNNFGFDIERSEDEIEFQKIGFVEGKGTTIVPQQYSFVDAKLAPGTYYYRLKQVDLDGAFEYTDVINITLTPPKEFSLAQNYPNPFNPETTIRYDLPVSAHVVLTVYNILGKEVKTLVDVEQSAGIKTVVWDGKDNLGKDVSSGAYIYQMKSGGFTEVKKLTLLR